VGTVQGQEGAILGEGQFGRRPWSRWHVHSSSGSGLSRKTKNLLATPVAGGSASARLRSPLHKKEAQERIHCRLRLPANPEFVNAFLTGRGRRGLASPGRRGRSSVSSGGSPRRPRHMLSGGPPYPRRSC